jgi:hypothetical protein
MRGFAIALTTSLALLLAGSAWAGKDEAKAKAGAAGKATEQQSEKAMERSNAQWKDTAQKGSERADSVKSKGVEQADSVKSKGVEQADSVKSKGAEQADSVKGKGAEMKGEAEAKAGKPSEAPGKRDEGALGR